MRCPICGTELEEDVKECYVCGYRLEISDEQEYEGEKNRDYREDKEDQEKGEQKKKSRKPAVIITVLFLFAVIGGMAFWFGIKDKTDKKSEEKEETADQNNRKDTEENNGEEGKKEKIDVNSYIGYWNISNNKSKELTIHNIEDDQIKFTLWYYGQDCVEDMNAILDGKTAGFSMDGSEGEKLEGVLTFQENAIDLEITASERAYMPAEKMTFSERHTPSWQEEEEKQKEEEEEQETEEYEEYQDAYQEIYEDPYLGGYTYDASFASYILPESSTRLLTEEDISWMDPETLALARNEIYARKGRIFYEEKYRSYFSAQSWYTGTILPEDFSEDMLSEIEKKNLEFIKSYE